ncbi:hypothetical protein OROHE_023906 [Orobanche hederae]
MAEIEDMVFFCDRKKEEGSGHDEKVSGRESEEQHSNGGVLSNLISGLVQKDNDEKEEKGSLCSCGHEEDENGGGIFSNLISGILHQSGGGGGDGGGKDAENEQKEARHGGLIDNIVSHLPTPLADDAAPGTEEASILIHSIVHD